MKALVLAAGEGKRIRSYTKGKPKEMINFFGKPFLFYVLKRIRDSGIKDVIIVISPKKKIIKRYFGDGKKFGMNIKYAIQKKQFGTADAIAKAKKYLINEKYFLVQYGDSLTQDNIITKILSKFEKEKNIDAYLILRTVEDPSRYGIVKFDKDKNIVAIVEKPKIGEAPSNKAVLGTYIMSSKFFDSIKNVKFEYGKEFFPVQYILLNGGKVKGFVYNGNRIDLGKPEDVPKAEKLLKKIVEKESVNTIIFDADNTLYETKSAARYADIEAMKILSKECNRSVNKLYKEWSDIVKKLRISKNPKVRTRLFSYKLLVKKYKLKESVAEKMYKCFKRNLLKKIKMKRNLYKTLKELKKTHKLILYSEDSKDLLSAKIKKFGIKKYFFKILSSEDIGIMKPNLKAYKILKEKFGINYKNTLVVGDSFERDLAIPKLLGMKTVLVYNKNKNEADFVVKNLKDLIEIVKVV